MLDYYSCAGRRGAAKRSSLSHLFFMFQMNNSGGVHAHMAHMGMNHGSIHHEDMTHGGVDHGSMDHGMRHDLGASSTAEDACSGMGMHHGMSVRMIRSPSIRRR